MDSDDPAFAGTMVLTWEPVVPAHSGRVDVHADEVPDISAEDHAAGLANSLANLAAFLQR